MSARFSIFSGLKAAIALHLGKNDEMNEHRLRQEGKLFTRPFPSVVRLAAPAPQARKGCFGSPRSLRPELLSPALPIWHERIDRTGPVAAVPLSVDVTAHAAVAVGEDRRAGRDALASQVLHVLFLPSRQRPGAHVVQPHSATPTEVVFAAFGRAL